MKYTFTPAYCLACVDVCVEAVVGLFDNSADCTSSRFHHPRSYVRLIIWFRIFINRNVDMDGGRTVLTIPYSLRRTLVIHMMTPGWWGLSRRVGFTALALQILAMILVSARLVSLIVRIASSLFRHCLSCSRVSSFMLSLLTGRQCPGVSWFCRGCSVICNFKICSVEWRTQVCKPF